MDQETMEAASPPPVATETESPARPGAEPGPAADAQPLDARALVEKMIEAGQNPEPELLEQIAAKGHEAVEPLLAILRSRPREWPEEAPLSHALGLLQVIRDPAAIPELIEIVKAYPDESGEEAADALACYGEGIFDTVLNLAAAPSLRGYPRSHAITAARRGAGANPTLRARLCEVIRSILGDAIERALGERSDTSGACEPPQDDFDMDIYDEISFLVNELASIADPLARDLIQTVLDKDLFDPYTVDAKSIEKVYESGGDPEWTPPDWLADYRESYRQCAAIRTTINELAAELRPSPGQIELPPPAPPRPVMPVTIRNKEQPVGRNDPCWCGSGKKYKKCHLGKDTTT
jgi:SEC-C motif